LHLQPPPRSIKPVRQQGFWHTLELVELTSCGIKVLLIEVVLSASQNTEDIIALNKPLAAEAERREEVRRKVSEQTSFLIRHERNAFHTGSDSTSEPRCEISKRLNTNIRHVRCLKRIERGGDDGIVLRTRKVTEHAKLLTERLAYGCINSVSERANSGPERVYAQVLVEVGRVIKCDTLKTLEVRSELVELRQASTTLLLDANLDLTDPATLQLNSLRDDLLLEARI
jgi:hypothetical protein